MEEPPVVRLYLPVELPVEEVELPELVPVDPVDRLYRLVPVVAPPGVEPVEPDRLYPLEEVPPTVEPPLVLLYRDVPVRVVPVPPGVAVWL